jgi:hypothetical protein
MVRSRHTIDRRHRSCEQRRQLPSPAQTLLLLGMTAPCSQIEATAGVARRCACSRPLRDDDSCLRCGRWLPQADVGFVPRRRRSGVNPWTAAGVTRALRAHRFFVGRLPAASEWPVDDDNDVPGRRTVAALFGSFDAALAAAATSAA